METTTQINIKGMVCDRCIETIKDSLIGAGYKIRNIFLGKVQFDQQLEHTHQYELREILKKLGFELLSDKNEYLLESIKAAISRWIESSGHGDRPLRLSDFLVNKFNRNYDSLSEFFSCIEGTTIEKYYIRKRIENVKELLVYTELSLSEIAFKTGFSSPHHLSSQFKSVTGQNPSEVRKIRLERISNQKRH